MTWIPTPPLEDQCFAAIKAGIDNAPPGVKVFLNSGEFYGMPPNATANLELLNRFFAKYPEYADRTFLSVKGALTFTPEGPVLDSSEAGIERSITNITEKLGPNKKVDLFECARVDPKVPIETVIAALNKYVEAGKIGAIGMSECSADTLSRAGKIGKIAAVEIEVSPWSFEEETQKVIQKAAEMGTVVAAYSPLGRGFLTGKLKVEELEKGDIRTHIPRFTDRDNLQKNMNIVKALTDIANKKGVTPAQLCLAWVSSLGPHVVPIPGSSRTERTLENMAAASIVLSQEELDEIKHALEANPVHGTRTSEAGMKFNWG
ncbi:aldo/keto reductase family protein [Ceratobasidium sp. AG-Ba]|nr:aldo/keto reductase family protein [Ceratobasidium sp. AG-Ba]QRW14644.1 aldo/keto reductase family protein [Ceratobasidium sp. AG-Ba]